MYGLTVIASASGADAVVGSRNAEAYARAVEPMSPRFASAISEQTLRDENAKWKKIAEIAGTKLD